jgi:hypothetical protein
MQQRQRFKQTKSLQDRLSEFIADARAKVLSMPESKDRDALLKKIRQAETAASFSPPRLAARSLGSNIEGWANSAGLQPPK